MTTHGFLIINFTITFIMTYIVMNRELPDGKFALKSLHSKLENIKYYTEKKNGNHFLFSIRIHSLK